MANDIASDAPGEPVEDRVRRRLRTLRGEQGLTLQQVAERANVDVSTLSRLEAGKRRLALDHLPRLAAALGVTVDHLVASSDPPDPRVRGRPRRVDGMTMWPIAHNAPSGLQAYRIAIDADRTEPPETLPEHEGHEWMYVLHGRLRLRLGRDEHLIDPGEAIEFSTWLPHWFGAVDGPVEVIAFFGPSGERAHLVR